MRSVRKGAVCAVVVAAGLLLGSAPAASGAPSQQDDSQLEIGVRVPQAESTAITNAELRWGLNRESSSGAFFGGCNFLSAGRAGDAGGARVWTAGDGLYASTAGPVRIVKADASGGWKAASFADRCLDATGTAVSASTSSSTQTQVVIDGGAGGRTADGGLRLSWSGSFTVVFYGGLTYWSVSNPVLELDASGNGRLTGTASGFGTSMEDQSKWEPLRARSIVLADIRGADVGGGGFATVPAYLGVSVSGAGQVAATAENAAYWGSFPESFIEFQNLTGQAGYWLTTGGLRDSAKPAGALTVNYDAAAPAIVPPTDDAAAGPGETASNDLRFRDGAAGGAAAGAATAAGDDAVTTAATGGAPVSLFRSGDGLIPDAITGISPLVLPIGGAVLAGLIAALSLLQATGKLSWPWSRPQ